MSKESTEVSVSKMSRIASRTIAGMYAQVLVQRFPVEQSTDVHEGRENYRENLRMSMKDGLGEGVRVHTIEPRSTVWGGSDKKM